MRVRYRKILCAWVIFIFLFLGAISTTYAIFNDDFEDYNLGDLNGQGGWIKIHNVINVTDSPVFFGTQAVRGSDGGAWYLKDAPDQERGTLTIWVRSDVDEDDVIFLTPVDGTIGNNMFHTIFGKGVEVCGGGNLRCVSFPTQNRVSLGRWNVGQWHRIQWQWDTPIHGNKIRARLDDNEWSDFLGHSAFNSGVINRFNLQLHRANTFADGISFSDGSEPPEPSLNERAADLTKELVNSAYLYGGKGWDYNAGEFVAPNIIKSGYNFWKQALQPAQVNFGSGVDCSGLVMWSYNRAFDPTKSRFNNFVKAEGADEQFRENTEPIAEVQLAPGDVLFSDFDSNGFIDHVAMFVGESGGFDVVNAADPDRGIVPDSKDSLKNISGFVAFKRVVSVLPPKVLVTAGSPVDLVVTDPDEFTITPETIIPSDLEFLRQIPGVLYYSEIEQGTDGRPIDQVYSYVAKTGDYLIRVVPEPDALPTDTFSLAFTTDLSTTTVLAENVPILDIPDQPYVIRVSEEKVEKIIPAKVKITPKTLNLGNRGSFSAIIEISKGFGVSVADINTETITINGAFPVKTTIAAGRFLVATFRTQDLKNVPSGNEVELKVSGNFDDGTVLEGTDTIRIISKGRFSDTFNQFNQFAGALTTLQSLLSRLLGLLQL